MITKPTQLSWLFVLLFKLLIHEFEKTLSQFIEDGKVFLVKVAEVSVQVFGWVKELEEIKGQFLDKVVKVFYLVVSVFTKLP